MDDTLLIWLIVFLAVMCIFLIVLLLWGMAYETRRSRDCWQQLEDLAAATEAERQERFELGIVEHLRNDQEL